MNKSNSAISVIFSILISIVFVALIAALLGFTFSYINNGQRNFYVKHGAETLPSVKKDVKLAENEYHVFTCGTVTGQVIDYDVQIFVNVNNFSNFDFSADTTRKNFKSDLVQYDCSVLFNLKKTETYFIIYIPNELSLYDVIKSKYPDQTLTDVPNKTLRTTNDFILTITDSVEQNKIELYFCGEYKE